MEFQLYNAMIASEIASLASQIKYGRSPSLTRAEVEKTKTAIFSPRRVYYICDLLTSEIVFQKNLDFLLGTDQVPETFVALMEYLHAEDKPKVIHIVKQTLRFANKKRNMLENGKLVLSYRILANDKSTKMIRRTSQMLASDNPGLSSLNLSILDIFHFANIPYAVQYGLMENGNLSKEHHRFVENSYPCGFTKCEKEILEMLMADRPLDNIADLRHNSIATIKKHVSNMYGKAKVSGRNALIDYYLSNSLATLPKNSRSATHSV